MRPSILWDMKMRRWANGYPSMRHSLACIQGPEIQAFFAVLTLNPSRWGKPFLPNIGNHHVKGFKVIKELHSSVIDPWQWMWNVPSKCHKPLCSGAQGPLRMKSLKVTRSLETSAPTFAQQPSVTSQQHQNCRLNLCEKHKTRTQKWI